MIAFDVLVVTDPTFPDWVDVVHRAIETAPSRVAILVRGPVERGAGELLHHARSLRETTRARGVPLLVSDRIDVALLADADGVHLKESGIEVAEARSLLRAGSIIGASCHDAAGLRRRAWASYVTLGPVGDVVGKSAPLSLDTFSELAATCSAPVFALGGVTVENAPSLVERGARGVAVVRGARDLEALLAAMAGAPELHASR